jgi:ribosomal protein S18 acetylase RimI-like enzyme
LINTRLATPADTDAIGELLHAFNTEYNDPTPSPAALSQRLKTLLATGDTAVILGELAATTPGAPNAAAPDAPAGLAVLRFRPSLWSENLECYLAELYVKPAHRGHGLGKSILAAAIDLAREKGADYMDLGTSADDQTAIKLYQSMGFTNRERPDGPIMYVFEREL